MNMNAHVQQMGQSCRARNIKLPGTGHRQPAQVPPLPLEGARGPAGWKSSLAGGLSLS